MKTKFFYIVFFLFALSCSNNDDTNAEQSNKVLLLQVDFMTNVFEGGQEFIFNSNVQNFNISSNYQEPGDFGNITLYYEELNTMLFDGSIIWMGVGSRTFPENLINPNDFQNNLNLVSMPSVVNFETVQYSEYSYYPEEINHAEIWDAIADLQLVEDYRNSNPDSKIYLFLYTPSVGVGDPNDWDWILFLKN